MSVKKETMIRMKKQMAEKILNHALGIIYLLTGEEYVMVKKNSPHTSMHLLTGDIPVKCGDISIYFSMEEWDYIEEHKDHYPNMATEEGIPMDRCSGSFKNSFNIVFLGEDDLSEKDSGIVNFCKETSTAESGKRSFAKDSHIGSQEGTLEEDTSTSHEKPEGNSSLASSTCDTGSLMSSCPQWECETWTENKNIISKDEIKKKRKKKKHKNSITETPKDVTMNGTNVPNVIHLCEDFGQCSSDTSRLVGHKRRHTGEMCFSCNKCEKHFSHNSQFMEPQRPHETCYWCGDCGIFYSYKSQLISHQRTHREDQFYRCDVCGQKFDFRCLLLVHQQIHTGEKPHQCSECGRRFTYRSGLVVHERTHTGEKPHRCKDCGERFSDGYSLVRHQKVHEVKAPHRCPDCGKQFGYRASLIIHQRTHKTQMKPSQSHPRKGQILSHAMTNSS
ncbi:hypothetical protein GDO81_003321 [Engystomops pustulosus]|uniref:C2H2-type domain-containing protein n=1 Tax=Engystomops pustulosus TaxID=76066 RepID=A0AAV6ZZ12_ENGPU|nr:hypothetical protein GDO81_003321 [Engystomops pustulosus]KAG8553217.1 hypothetical protein GDO81_003321 [Engystomops pustulosus]KAG8553218.1 hypothetical protein GDO81_003321 [Engystomops pustulosus]KAG8553219.1 hypothetical protein GDO81_003321 [Engystomops pustulosus]